MYTISSKKHFPDSRDLVDHVMQWDSWFVLFPPWYGHKHKKYLELLKGKLKIYIDIHQCRIFMHDDAPCNRSRIISDFLKNQKVEVLQRPGNNPDL